MPIENKLRVLKERGLRLGSQSSDDARFMEQLLKELGF